MQDKAELVSGPSRRAQLEFYCRFRRSATSKYSSAFYGVGVFGVGVFGVWALVASDLHASS